MKIVAKALIIGWLLISALGCAPRISGYYYPVPTYHRPVTASFGDHLARDFGPLTYTWSYLY